MFFDILRAFAKLFENKDFYNEVMGQIRGSVYKELRNTSV